MASRRNTVLVIDKKGDISHQVSGELKTLGYHTLCVEDMGTFLPLLDSRDRIYTMVFADSGFSVEALKGNIKALKQLGAGVPLIITTSFNESQKEKEVRKNGVFFYHVMGDGMASLVEAIRSAMKHAILKEKFIPFVDF